MRTLSKVSEELDPLEERLLQLLFRRFSFALLGRLLLLAIIQLSLSVRLFALCFVLLLLCDGVWEFAYIWRNPSPLEHTSPSLDFLLVQEGGLEDWGFRNVVGESSAREIGLPISGWLLHLHLPFVDELEIGLILG